MLEGKLTWPREVLTWYYAATRGREPRRPAIADVITRQFLVLAKLGREGSGFGSRSQERERSSLWGQLDLRKGLL
jgi:hypothetical protein